ncbi:sigma-70 family RNA polymerase sigma factor [Roseibacillus persicicus]|uniref:Uncharacterized protein n=1 Tax=Roseibacillus persicicus TaxID=454148 RepID=A0A918TNU4_9BACT|nr:sigma-70 family RNA polymerase sigma factor [Roseibacillus persicicus]GHC55927.1 hypothetical protein GCM10007100_23480 [Roseibacillus persicicus]
MKKTTGDGNNVAEEEEKGLPVDDAFWIYFTDEESQSFLRNFLRKTFPRLTEEDIEDVVADIKLKYAKSGARRHEVLGFSVLACLARRAAIDYVRRLNRKRAGGGVFHDSIEDSEGILNLAADPIVDQNRLDRLEEFSNLLGLAKPQCNGKPLMVVNALQRWLQGGCSSDYWTDFLLPEEVEEFMKLKKGVSLAGKASPAFCAVKKILREILEKKGMSEDSAA